MLRVKNLLRTHFSVRLKIIVLKMDCYYIYIKISHESSRILNLILVNREQQRAHTTCTIHFKVPER